MPDYRRAYEPGGTLFFTIVTHQRRPVFVDNATVELLRRATADVRRRRPFDIQAAVVLPDHVHTIWRLPQDDADFSTRWRLVKAQFTQAYLLADGNEGSRNVRRHRKGERAVWQHRFWEHTVRDEQEFQALCDYVHYNPVRHGLVSCPHAWPYSSFTRFVDADVYPADWLCTCRGPLRTGKTPTVSSDVTGEDGGSRPALPEQTQRTDQSTY